MSDADWDAEDFEPAGPAKPKTDKWEGEDEEEETKDNWDDDEDQEEKTEASGDKPKSTKKKKTLKEKIAEKEAKRKEELEKRRKEEEEFNRKMTPAEAHAAKLRQQKLQEEADLQLAKETFGVSSNDELAGRTLDTQDPSTKDEFETFGGLLKDKIQKYEKNPHYNSFLENLIRDLSLSLDAEELKRIGATLNALSNEKAKLTKTTKGKKKSKKATLTVSKGGEMQDYEDGGGYDEFEDFI